MKLYLLTSRPLPQSTPVHTQPVCDYNRASWTSWGRTIQILLHIFKSFPPAFGSENRVIPPLSPALLPDIYQGVLSRRASQIHGRGWLPFRVFLFLLRMRNASLLEPKRWLISRCHTHLTGLRRTRLLPKPDSWLISLTWAVSPSRPWVRAAA